MHEALQKCIQLRIARERVCVKYIRNDFVAILNIKYIHTTNDNTMNNNDNNTH